MNWLKKVRSFVVLVFVCASVMATSLASCGKGDSAKEETTEHPAEEKAEHPKAGAESEHPKSDSTEVEEVTP